MEICLKNGVIKIDVEAIHRLLGIPKTGLNLKSIPKKRKLSPRIQQWSDLYGKEYMSPRDIASRMSVDVSDDSLDFELDFLVLFVSTMVEFQAHGKCGLEMLDYLDDYIDFSFINWSAYVSDCIKRCKSGWEPFTKKPFKGALTILTLLYVERFSCEGDEKVKKLLVDFEEIFKQKLHVEEAEPHNGANVTVSKPEAETCHQHNIYYGENLHSGEKRLEKSHEESPESVVNHSDNSPKKKHAVVDMRKSDIKRLKLASAAKSGNIILLYAV
ncbi:hypothetical protein R6Q59_007001 [Mikania micrantha]